MQMARSPLMHVRAPAEMKATLEEIAKSEDRTLSNLIIHILKQWLSDKGIDWENHSPPQIKPK